MANVCMQSFMYSLAVAVYIGLVSIFMSNAENWFGKNDTILSGIAFLMLFSLSALVVGGLLAGKPIMLFIEGKKKEAVKMLICSGGWLLFFLLVAVVALKLIGSN